MSLPTSILISAAAAGVVLLGSVRPDLALFASMLLTIALPLSRSTFGLMWLIAVIVGVQAVAALQWPVSVIAGIVFVELVVNDVWQRIAFDRTFDDPALIMPLLLVALVVGFGTQFRTVRRREAQLISLQNELRERALFDERRRIARDVHDVAAHHLSAVVVRAKLARRQGTYAALVDAADFTAGTATEALDALRGVVHVLRGSDQAQLAPQPTLEDLNGIVDRVRAAGLEVFCDVEVDAVPSRHVQSAAVRIVQEGLANVLRHRGPGRAWLTLASQQGWLRVIVEDDGPGRPDPQIGDTLRRGLLGVRERAEACGGRCVIDTSPRGGWRITATLPVGGT